MPMMPGNVCCRGKAQTESSEADLSGRFLLRLLRPIAHSKDADDKDWAEAEKTDIATGLQVCHALKY